MRDSVFGDRLKITKKVWKRPKNVPSINIK